MNTMRMGSTQSTRGALRKIIICTILLVIDDSSRKNCPGHNIQYAFLVVMGVTLGHFSENL